MKRPVRREPVRLVRDVDLHRLRDVLSSRIARHFPATKRRLAKTLDRARIVPARSLPPSVVAMGSRVTVWDDLQGKMSDLALVYPWQASPRDGAVSVLSRLGSDLLGAVPGEKLETGEGLIQIIFVHAAVEPARAREDDIRRRAG